MATHSSILTWKIPWTEEPAGGGKKSDTTEELHFNFHSSSYLDQVQAFCSLDPDRHRKYLH